MNLYITAIIAIFVVLQIILFFKLWGMTNDVKRVKELLCDDTVEKCIIKGDSDKAYDLITESLYSVLNGRAKIWSEKYFLQSAVPIIESYRKKAELIGRDLPENLSNPEKFMEIFKKVNEIETK